MLNLSAFWGLIMLYKLCTMQVGVIFRNDRKLENKNGHMKASFYMNKEEK